jgi:hypothetical protein
MRALKCVFPEMEEEDGVGGRFNYPRPISEPPSPSSSRVTTPAPSEHGSDAEEDDEVDEEKEVSCIICHKSVLKKAFMPFEKIFIFFEYI